MDDLDALGPKFTPNAKRPLLGMTVLVVEDSRFASEALRLMCLRSGGRIRRADCLRSARRHLQVYRPSVVLIDLGLPDGSGLELIEEMNRAHPRVGAIIAISGDDHVRSAAKAAGADNFLAKPVETIGVFQNAILSSLPHEQAQMGPCALSDDTVHPDRLTYQEDMSHIASLLDDPQDEAMLDYVAQFLGSVARAAQDPTLERAATELADARAKGGTSRATVARLAGMVHERINEKVAM